MKKNMSRNNSNRKINYRLFRVKLTILSLIISYLNQTPSFAATTNLELVGVVKISYSSPVKLVKTGCQNLKMKYKVNEDFPRIDSAFAINIAKEAKKSSLAAEVGWYSSFSSTEMSDVVAMARQGYFDLKLCRKKYIKTWNNGEASSYNGISPGKYIVYIGGGSYNPETKQQINKTTVVGEILFK
jgi:hypothetical protein